MLKIQTLDYRVCVPNQGEKGRTKKCLREIIQKNSMEEKC